MKIKYHLSKIVTQLKPIFLLVIVVIFVTGCNAPLQKVQRNLSHNPQQTPSYNQDEVFAENQVMWIWVTSTLRKKLSDDTAEYVVEEVRF